MSYSDAYQSPQYVPVIPKPGARQLEYMRMFMFVFDNPNWAMNLLWGSLCILVSSAIPIVPQMILAGYTWELIELWHRQGHDRYPDFDTGKLGDYLGRGVWPFLVTLVLSLAMMAIMMPVIFIGMFGTMALVAQTDQPAFLLLYIVLFLFIHVLAIGMNVVMIPMLLRAGLSQSFGEGFNFGWVMSFIKLTFKEILLGSLFLMVGNTVVIFGGMALLCIGVYPAATLVMLAWAHFLWQLYQIFLDRGGEPIPLKTQFLTPPAGR